MCVGARVCRARACPRKCVSEEGTDTDRESEIGRKGGTMRDGGRDSDEERERRKQRDVKKNSRE